MTEAEADRAKVRAMRWTTLHGLVKDKGLKVCGTRSRANLERALLKAMRKAPASQSKAPKRRKRQSRTHRPTEGNPITRRNVDRHPIAHHLW